MSQQFLAGRRFLVVGGASGIGLAVAQLAAEQAAVVSVMDINEQALHSAPWHTQTCDVSDANAVQQAIQNAAAALGGIDAIVNAAGIDSLGPLETLPTADWERTLTINLTGPMLVCRAATPYLRASGTGTIVNISSAAGLTPLRNRSAYCTSKAALIMFSKALAMELAVDNIRVNAICPGAVDTPLLHSSYQQSDGQAPITAESVKERYALRRIATPEELAHSVLYLSSGASSYVTGTAHAVDGGRSFH